MQYTVYMYVYIHIYVYMYICICPQAELLQGRTLRHFGQEMLRGEGPEKANLQNPDLSGISLPTPPNVPSLRALWSLLVGIWGVLECSWGVLVDETCLEHVPITVGHEIPAPAYWSACFGNLITDGPWTYLSFELRMLGFRL